MARTGKLTRKRIDSWTPGKYSDGGNLWLRVRPSGKNWIFRYTIAGKEHQMGLGCYPDLSAKVARERATEFRRMLSNGLDPMSERRKRARDTAPAFSVCAARYIKAHAAGWKNPKHRQQWTNTLETYADPIIGERAVNLVDVNDVLHVLEPIWETKSETAGRIRGRIERILDWATVRGYRAGENPARWRGNLDALLPKRSKVRKVKHHTALPWAEVPAFLVELRKRKGYAAKALEFAILTAARSGEVRKATWQEIDMKARTWTVPADHMKMGVEHRVPLSGAAVALLKALPQLGNSPLLFPNGRGRPLSDMALLQVCRRMEVDVVPHGFRSSFRDWCAESTSYPREVAEHALAHMVGSKVEAAYFRSDLFDKRRPLMALWGEYLETPQPAGATVTAIGAGR